MTDLLAVPAARREAIQRIAAALHSGRTVALSAHINADGERGSAVGIVADS